MEKEINSEQLKALETIIKEFMVDRSGSNKTFAELLKIFDGCYQGFNPDPSNDLRICCYASDMKSGKWNQDIMIKSHNGVVQDGIHRGLAYLKCVAEGVEKSRLPKLLLIEN